MSGSFPDEVKLAFGSWLTDPEDQQEKEDALYSEWEALSARDISDSTLERRRKLNLIHRHMEGEKPKTLRPMIYKINTNEYSCYWNWFRNLSLWNK